MSPSQRTHDLLSHLIFALSELGASFQRTRCWSPRRVIMAVMMLTRPDQRMSYATLLVDQAEAACRLLGVSATPTKSSLSVARGKVPVAAFRSVLHRLVEQVSALIPGQLRHHGDRRFIAVDATSLVCPRSASTVRGLDCPRRDRWLISHYPRALVVVALDVVRRLPLEWVLLPKGTGERAALQPLLQHLRRGDVVIVDRGYPARWLLGTLVEHGVDAVMRMTAAKVGAWSEVQAFLASGAKTAVVDIAIGSGRTIAARLIRRNPPPGRPRKHQRRDTMVVLTTLLPRHGFEAKDILDLYGRRWGVESLFREMKEAFAIEHFHTRSLDGIQQEIATTLMWMALSATIEATVQSGLPDGRRVNRSVCRHAARNCLLNALVGRDTNLEAIITEAGRHAYTPRPGRSFPRESKLPFGRFRKRA